MANKDAGLMEEVHRLKKRLKEYIYEDNMVARLLAQAEERTKVERIYFVYGFMGFIALYLLVGYGSTFLCNFIGFLYPAYASIKAIESKEKDDDTQWLTYWVVYATFSLVEFFTDIFLFWIPFYAFFKCIFLLYCMAPSHWNGSIALYRGFIRPFILSHEKEIDSVLAGGRDMVNSAVSEAERELGSATVKAAMGHGKSE